MTDFLDESAKQLNTEPAAITSNLITRLLQRKVSSGVVVPKIRSKIEKITRTSDKIRRNRIVLPGRQRRENIKSFGETLQARTSRNPKNTSQKLEKKQQTSWENLDMLLPNGTTLESSRSSLAQSNLSNIGLSAGGQVITPFSPPSLSNEPSFIERRQARLNAQEQKKTKPNLIKHDASTRLFSRVEEIIPNTDQKTDQKSEKIKKSDQILPAEKKSDEPKIERPLTKKSEQVKKTASQNEYPEEKTIANGPSISTDNNSVVQRQLEKDINTPTSKANEKKVLPEQRLSSDAIKIGDTFKLGSDIEKDLNTLAPRKLQEKSRQEQKSSSEKETKEIEFKNPPPKNKIKGNDKKFKESKSKQISEIIPFSLDKGKSKIPAVSSQKEEIKPISEDKSKEPSIKPPTIEPKVSSVPPLSIQRELEKTNKSVHTNKSETQETQREFSDDKKLDLPLITQKASIPDKEKTIPGKPSSVPLPRDLTGKTEKEESLISQRSIADQKIELPEDTKKVKTTTKQTDKPVISEKKIELGQKSEKPKQITPLEKPLVIPRIKKMALSKTFLNYQINKIKRVVKEIKKPVTRSTSGRRLFSASKPLRIQRQISKEDLRIDSQSMPEIKSFIPSIKSKGTDSQTKREHVDQSKDLVSHNDQTRTFSLTSRPRSKKYLSLPSKKISVIKKKTQRNLEKVMIAMNSSPILKRSKSDLPLPINKSEKTISFRNTAGSPNEVNDRMGKPRPRPLSLKQKISPVFNSPIGEEILLTSAGRKSIQNLFMRDRSGEKPQTNEGINPFVVPIINKETGFQKSKSPDLSVKKTGFTAKTERIMRKGPNNRTDRSYSEYSQQKSNVSHAQKARPEMELPVVQSKKVEPVEQFIKPELAVAGPVVQREINSSTELDNLPSVPNQIEKPNLEELAKEVYPIIKRWIAVEKERTSGRLY
ncbi:MAG: hypothetical protein Q7U53_11840 [Anaerolineaceae bacterium]|nr:hypothetical protein [Anaerolineaceae bacterium]